MLAQRLTGWLIGCLLLSTLCSAWSNAQDLVKWKITAEPSPYVELFSVPMDLNGKQTFCGLNSTTLVIRDASSEPKKWTCIQLPEFKQLSEFEEPQDWNPAMSSFGSRFACSVTRNELITVDLTTGKLLPKIRLRQMAQPHILFDKAIWLESSQLLTLPQLQAVTNHPLSTNLVPEFDELNFRVGRRTPLIVWYLDGQRVVVNGMVLGEDFKVGPQYLGCYTWRSSPSPGRPFLSGDITPATSDKPTTFEMFHSDNQKIEATTTERFDRLNRVSFNSFRGGLYAVSEKNVFIFKSPPNRPNEEISRDLENQPVMIPPLLKFDETHHRMRWLPQAPKHPFRLVIGMDVDYKFAGDETEIWMTSRAKEFLDDERQMTKIVQRIQSLSKVPRGSSFDQTIAAYKARNMWWIRPYATSVGATFVGVPVEVNWTVRYEPYQREWPTSVIVDFPLDALKKFWKDPLQWKADPSLSADVRQTLEELAKKEQRQELEYKGPELPEPPSLAPLPPAVDLNKIQSAFSWASAADKRALMLAPLTWGIQFIGLMVMVRFLMLIQQPVRLVGNSMLVAVVASLAIVSFGGGFQCLVNVITASQNPSAGLEYLRGFLVVAATTAFSFWLYHRALVGPMSMKVLIFVFSQMFCLAMSIVINIIFAVRAINNV